MTAATRTETVEAVAKLREMLPPGSVAYTIIRHVSQSRMTHHINVVLPSFTFTADARQNPPIVHVDSIRGGIEDITYLVARALEMRRDLDTGGIVMRGVGMDMGFAIVYDLSHVLYPEGFGCIGPSCPSNDHSNGDRDYTPHDPTHDFGQPQRHNHWHTSGGYAVSHRSL